MKNLLLNTSCVDNHHSDRPDTLIITLTNELATTLLVHMNNVTELDLHAIEILNNGGKWLSGDEYTEQELLEKFENNDYADLVQNMELGSIKIYADFCRFYATPKYCGDAEKCFSDRLTKEKLLEILKA
ncbi:hypothetical protein OTK49_20995 [Vibrio coralliirubri]|uniref:hypothetical protein n=1 Tax=Vibrio coralliirubri TaxID=1516159 RepID=UPI0022853171|nr:hypothetical protein [Vibrio coralliirubri]MCY9864997.1 hypothetical protein [Vibrio coralliirubri]